MAGLFHQLSFADWRWYTAKGLVLTVAILWVLLKPSSWKRFSLLVIIDWVSVAWAFPYHPNHIVFSWIVNGTLLAGLFLVLREDSSDTDVASRWFRAVAPWLRVELCMLYFFTVFHKLNTSYFDLDWSCAAKMHSEISAWMPLLPGSKWAQYLGIYATLIIETAIPLMLLFGRTRVAGAMLGLLFHGLLALHPHQGLFSFSSTMTALFTVFMPLGLAESLIQPGRFKKLFIWLLSLFAAWYLLWVGRRWLPSGFHMEQLLEHISKVGFVVYYVYLTYCIVTFIRSARTIGLAIQAPGQGSWLAHTSLIVLPVLLFINGFGPYLGLRTQTSFSMFSNLHTENGMSNHLIVPPGIQVTDWQRDLVEIIDSNEPFLTRIRDNDFLLVYMDLRRQRSLSEPDFWVTFRRNGRIETFDAKRPETHSTIPPLNLLAQRYFYFRPVERDPAKVRCKH